jgi:hypothetical protein
MAPPAVSNVANVTVDPAYGLIVTFGFASIPLQTGDEELDAQRADLKGNPTTVTARILLSAPTAETLLTVISDALKTIASLPAPEVLAITPSSPGPKTAAKTKS